MSVFKGVFSLQTIITYSTGYHKCQIGAGPTSEVPTYLENRIPQASALFVRRLAFAAPKH